jgi:uncharacterized repeat protein (TIGR03847 family)
MSSQLFEFNQPERFLIGTVGVPGEREFYLQVKGLTNGRRVFASFALEKSQAAALSERIREMVRQLKLAFPSVEPDLAPLETPIEAEFILGVMSLTWLAEEKLFLFEAQEIAPSDLGEIEEGTPDVGAGLSLLRVRISLEDIGVFAKRTDLVVAAGRQPCVFCGGPINPGGHLCPRANGYRRQL